MSQTGTPNVTASNVLADLQVAQQSLALQGTDTSLMTADEIVKLQRDQQVLAILVAAVTAYAATQATTSGGSASSSSSSSSTAPPSSTAASTFKPANPTPNDIYTSAATLALPDTKSRNIICTGSTPTKVTSWLANASSWNPLPDTSDGGKVWQDVHDSYGTVITLYFCAPGIA